MFFKLSPACLAALLIPVLVSLPVRAGSWPHEQGTLHLDQAPERIVALNWAAAETLLLLGVTPVGVADLDSYRYWVEAPSMPESWVASVGLRMAPSLEAIAELKPDLIITSSEMAPAAERLQKIAPTYVHSVYRKGSRPFASARTQLLTLAEMTGRRARAEAVLADLRQTLKQERTRLQEAGLANTPVLLLSFMDERHLRVYTPNGLFQKAVEGLGLTNAWPDSGNFWGFSVAGLDALARYPEARLVVLSPTPPGLARELAESPLWTHLPAVRRQQVYQVDSIWPFGGVYQVQRLALQLADRLLAGGSRYVQ